jgi:putative ABC transport system substrate-binding protein
MVRVNRRRFLFAAGGLLAAPTFAQQSSRVYTVGVLFGLGAESMGIYRAALVERLAGHGYVEHRNLRVEARAAHLGTSATEVDELIRLQPDALLTCTTFATQTAQAVAGTTPIVFAWVADPVASKFVETYARPGGNITGVTNRFGELVVKRLELAHDLLPGAKRVAVVGVESPLYRFFASPMRRAAGQLGVELTELPAYDWEASVEQAKTAGAAAIIVFAHFSAGGMQAIGKTVVKAALRERIPVIFAEAELVEAGGLVSYGTNPVDDIRRAADLLARVLKGEDPATIPVDQAARFELAVNLQTAKAIGITIPQSILLRADRVIE